MLRVFISHSSKDVLLASAVADLISAGISSSELEVFCSSLAQYGIPAGEDFKTYIRTQLRQSDIVAAVLTNDYYASGFCMHELGAAWALEKRVLPLLAPSMSFSDLGGLIGEVEAVPLNDDRSLDLIRELFTGISTPVAAWNAAKLRFLELIRRNFSPVSQGEEQEPRTYARSESPDCHGAVERALRRARRIVMIGTGLNVLKNRALMDDIVARERTDACRVEIYLGDRLSPSIQSRLIEEHLFDTHRGPSGVQPADIYHDLKSAGVSESVPTSHKLDMTRHHNSLFLYVIRH